MRLVRWGRGGGFVWLFECLSCHQVGSIVPFVTLSTLQTWLHGQKVLPEGFGCHAKDAGGNGRVCISVSASLSGSLWFPLSLGKAATFPTFLCASDFYPPTPPLKNVFSPLSNGEQLLQITMGGSAPWVLPCSSSCVYFEGWREQILCTAPGARSPPGSLRRRGLKSPCSLYCARRNPEVYSHRKQRAPL